MKQLAVVKNTHLMYQIAVKLPTNILADTKQNVPGMATLVKVALQNVPVQAGQMKLVVMITLTADGITIVAINVLAVAKVATQRVVVMQEDCVLGQATVAFIVSWIFTPYPVFIPVVIILV